MKPPFRPESDVFGNVGPARFVQAACGLAFDHGRLQEEHRELQAAHDHFVEAAVRLSCGDVAGTRREFCLAMHGEGCGCAGALLSPGQLITVDYVPGPTHLDGKPIVEPR